MGGGGDSGGSGGLTEWWWWWWWGGGGGGVGYRIEVSKNEGELRIWQVYGMWALLSKREWGGVVWTYFTGK